MNANLQETAQQTGAETQWDSLGATSLEWFERVGPWILLACVIGLLARALYRAHHFRTDSVLAPEAEKRVHAALIEAERHTIGEVVPVVLGRSDAHPSGEWRSGLVMLVVGSALLEGVLPWTSPWLVILCQVGLGAIGFGLARMLPGWKRMFVTEKRATEVALEQASLEFQRLELQRTEARTGVLVFVSLFERRVVVLGDTGIHATVGDAHWSRTRDEVLAGINRGDLASGLVDGIRACGEVLTKHFPVAVGDRNEVPDRMVVRAE